MRPSRQVDVIEAGGAIVQETRLYDPDAGTTRSMRSKEDAHDYRYFPDPDLLPLELDDAFLDECRASLPELARREAPALRGRSGSARINADVLTAEVEAARWFDALLDTGAAPAAAANWTTSELFGALNRLGKDIAASPVSPAQAGELLALVADGTLSGTLAKQVFEIMLETAQRPGGDRRGARASSRPAIRARSIRSSPTSMAANADKVAEYRSGKDKLFGFFVGQTMKAMAGKANPQVVNAQLKKTLG